MRYNQNYKERGTHYITKLHSQIKNKIVRLHEKEGQTYKSITAEYGISKASISKWCSEFSNECQTSPETKAEYDNMKELLKLKCENEELYKENLFIKKRRHSLQRKSIRGLSIY